MLVCITGEIGSGKSTALKIIKNQGFHTFNMDGYIHRIYRWNKIGYQLINKHFGSNYVNNVQVDRIRLGKLVFSNSKELKKLNRLIIPLMQAQLQKMLKKSDIFFVEMGIYMHQRAAFSKYFQKVIFIDAKKTLKNKNLAKKMPYLRKFPTSFVGKLEYPTKTRNRTKYIVVENYKNLKKFKENILEILQNF
ncbi:MAG: dephospho-CoA kinase [Mycoplasmataceae bacterium]|nr:dephospho-CoA kinase [Mycoplasmataceae bacterium]